MCKFSSKSGGGGVPFQSLGDLTWNDPPPSLQIIPYPIFMLLATHIEHLVLCNSIIDVLPCKALTHFH